MSETRTYVEFKPKLEPGDARYLTDEQWLFLIKTVDTREGWGWALPKAEGEPARVLPPIGEHVYRCDADGSSFVEPWYGA